MSLPATGLRLRAEAGSAWARQLFKPVEAARGVSVGVAAGEVGGGDEEDFLFDVVEGEHLVEEQEERVGNAEFVLGKLGQALDEADDIVGEKADRTGGEGRQAG